MSRWKYIALAALVAGCQGGSKDDKAGGTEGAKTAKGSPDSPGPVQMPTDDTPTADLIGYIGSYDRVVLDELRRAIASCKILGKRGDASSLQAVLAVASKPLEASDTGNGVRQACVRALGAFKGPRVVEALLAIARADPKAQPMVIHGAAIQALGQVGDPSAIEPIIAAMVAHPELGDSARAALAALGDNAIEPLIANLTSPPAGGAPGTVKFHSARILGDLRAEAAVPALLASLAEEAEPAMFSKNGELGPTHHVAVIESLQKIGGESAAAPLRAYWNKTTDDSLRVLALDAYGWVTRSDAAHAELSAMLLDKAGVGRVRMAAGLAYARTVYTATQLGVLRRAVTEALAGDEADRQWHRMLAALIARAYPGVACKKDVACYQQMLEHDDDRLATDILEVIPEGEKLAAADRDALPNAMRERALLELAKLGRDSAPAVDAILEVAKSNERLVRLASLKALVAAAERPCSKCSEALTAIADATPSGAVPAQVVVDTDATASYFRAR